MIANKLCRSEWANAARQILQQYNAAGFNHCASLTFHGPHYVTYDCGEFRLRPYGGWARYRHEFECCPEIVPWQDELLWVFQVRTENNLLQT